MAFKKIDTGDWNKKLHFNDFIESTYYANRTNIEPDTGPWEKENDELIKRKIFYYFKNGIDLQKNCNVWVDDNCDGYWYSELSYTEGGTPIVRDGDKVGLTFYFQKLKDAKKFEELANDELAKYLMWS